MKDEPEFQSDEIDRFVRKQFSNGIRNAVIFLATLATVWSLLSFFLPDGWWHLVINIGAFVFTVAISATIHTSLKALGNPGWLAWAISIGIWFVAVLLVRSFGLAILESVF